MAYRPRFHRRHGFTGAAGVMFIPDLEAWVWDRLPGNLEPSDARLIARAMRDQALAIPGRTSTGQKCWLVRSSSIPDDLCSLLP